MGAPWQFHRKKQRLIAKFTLLFLLWQIPFSSVAAASTAIMPDGTTATVVTTDHDVTHVTTDTIIGGHTGLNSFTYFDVGYGHTANLQIPDGADNLVNLVHSRTSVIDGVLNAVQGGQIGGNVYFLNPHGMVIGADGVVNVGSFHFATPTEGFMNDFVSRPETSIAAVLDGTVPITPSGRITVNGTINAIKDISLQAGEISSSGAIQSGAEFQFEPIHFSDVVNVAGFQEGTQVAIEGGQIRIVATGGHIDLDLGTVLYTGGSDEADIEIEAIGVHDDGAGIQGTQAQATIAINDATLIGNDISIRAASEAEHSWGLGNPLLDKALELAGDLADVEVGIVQAEATSEVVIGAGSTIVADGDVTIEASSTVSGTVTVDDGDDGAFIGLIYGNIHSDASVTVGSDATIEARNLDLASINQAELQIEINADSSERFPLATGVAVGIVDVNSSAVIEQGATVRLSESLSVDATNTSSFRVGAKATAEDGGIAGVATAVLTASTFADARIDADLSGLNHVSITALDTIDANVVTAETSVSGESKEGDGGDGQGQSESKLAAITGWIQGKVGQSAEKAEEENPETDDESGVTGLADIGEYIRMTGAVTVVVADHGASAAIGDGAEIDASGSVSVSARVEDRGQQASAVSGVNSGATTEDDGSMVTVGGALVVGHFAHEAVARVGDGASVAARNLNVTSQVERTLASSDFEWDGVQAIHDRLEKKESWTDNLLSGLASSTGGPGQVGFGATGSILFLHFSSESEAYIGEDAHITVKDGDGTGVSVAATTDISGAFAAGSAISPPPAQEGEGDKLDSLSIGGSFAQVNYVNTTRAYVSKGAVIETEGAGDVAVTARTDERQLLITPGMGASDALGLNGNLALSLMLSETEASLDDQASIEARNISVSAATDAVAFALSGGYHRTGDKNLSASIAGQYLDLDTRAFVGDNDHYRDLSSPQQPSGAISAENLSVRAQTDTRVDSFTTESSNSASVAVSVVNVDTSATLSSSPSFQISNTLLLHAHNTNSFSVNSTTSAKEGEVAGIAAAILIANTDAYSVNHADLPGISDVTIVALDVTEKTQVTTSTTVEGQKPDGGGDGGEGGDVGDVDDEELGDGTGESDDVTHSSVSGVRAKGENLVESLLEKNKPEESAQEKAGLNEAGVEKEANDLQFPKLGGAVTVVVTSHDATARIADDVEIGASGNVAVVAQTRQSGLLSKAETAVTSQGSTGSRGLPLSLSAAIVVGVYSHGAEASIGRGADITAQNVGVRSDVIRTYEMSWHKWEGVSTVTGKLNKQLGLVDGYLSGYANAKGSVGAKEVGITGSILVMNFTNDSKAFIDDGAAITVLSGAGETWQSPLTLGEDGDALEWNRGLTVAAGAELLGAFAAGDIDITLKGTSGGKGAVSLGGSFAQVNHFNSTMGYLGKGVVITSAPGADAPDVSVNALTNEGLFLFAPMAGRGASYGMSGNLALALIFSDTQARIDDDAHVTARDLRVDAEENVVSFAVTGAINQAEALGVGVGVSIQVVNTHTDASLGQATIGARSVSVGARTDGIIETISVAGSVTTSKNAAVKSGTKTSSWKSKVTGALDKAFSLVKGLADKKDETSPEEVEASGEALGAIEDEDKSARPDDLKPNMGSGIDGAPPDGGSGGSGGTGGGGSGDAPPEGPSFGVGISGSSSVNVVSLNTTATVDGAEINLTGAPESSLSVVGVNDTDIGAFSGGASLVRAKNSSTKFSAGVGGSLAVNVLTNRTMASVDDAFVTGARDVSVHALSGGDQLAIALGLAVNDSGKESFNASVAGSVSVSVAANTISAGIAGSEIEGVAGLADRGQLDVTAYDRTRLASGGGSILGGGKAGLGGSVTYTGIHNSTDAFISGSSVSRFTEVGVRGLNASMIAAGGAMGGLQMDKEGVSFGGTFVISAITNTTSARIEANSSLAQVGDVSVLARDISGFAALDEVIDLRDCQGAECEGEGHARFVDYTGADVHADGSMEEGADEAGDGAAQAAEDAAAEADEQADQEDEAAGVVRQGGGAGPGGGKGATGAGDDDDDDDDGSFFGGSSIVSAAGVVQGGGNNVGLSFTWNTIANDFIAEVSDSSIEADGDLSVVAQSNATIIGASVGAGAGDKFAGGGSISANHTLNRVIARVSGTSAAHRVEVANLEVWAVDRSDISALAGNVGLVGGANGAAAVGASIAFSGINNKVHAAIDGIDVESDGAAQVVARNLSVIRTLSVTAAATDGTASVAGSASLSEIANQTVAEVVSDRGNTVRVGSLVLSSKDESTINTLSGQLSAGGKAAVGGAVAVNWISNTTRSRIDGANVESGGSIELASRNRSTIRAMAASGGVSETAAVNGSAVVSVIFNRTEAEFLSSGDESTTASELSIRSEDDSSILALGGQLSGAGKAAVGGAVVLGHIFNTSRATLGAGVDVSGRTLVEAINRAQIYATSASGGGSGTAAVNGSLVFSFVGNQTLAEVTGESGAALVQSESLRVNAEDTSMIGGLSGAISGAGTAAVGGAANLSNIVNTTRARVAAIDVEAESVDVDATNRALIISAALAGQGAGTAAVGGSITTNVIVNRTLAEIVSDGHNTVASTVSLGVGAQDQSGIYTIAGSVSGAGTAGVGAGAATNTVVNTTKSLIENVHIAGNADAKVDAENAARIVAIGVTGQGAGTAAIGATLTLSVIANTAAAEVRSVSGNSLSAKNLAVQSRDRSEIYSIALQVSGAGSAAVGGTSVNNLITNTTRSQVDGVAVNVAQQSLVDARNESIIVGVAVSGGGAGTAAVGGSLAFSGINNRTLAEVTGGATITSGSLAVTAGDWAQINSVSGRAAGAGAAAVGGAMTIGEIGNTTQARIEGAKVVSSGHVSVDATNDSVIRTLAAAGGGAATAAVFGSAVFSFINNRTVAETRGGQGIEAGSLAVTAADRAEIDSLAGQVAGAGAASVGAAVSVSEIGNWAHARVAGTPVTAEGAVAVSASNDSKILTMAASAGGAGSASVRGSDTTNIILNDTVAEVCAIGQCADDEEQGGGGGMPQLVAGSLSVTAKDSSEIWSMAGQVGGAVNAAVGGALAHNQILNRALASVSGYTTRVTHDADIEAANSSQIMTVSASGGGSGVGASVQGSVSSSHINNWTEARMVDGAAQGETGNYTVRALDEAHIGSISGAIGINFGPGAGVGLAVSVNQIGNTTKAHVSGSPSNTEYDLGNLLVMSQSRATIDSLAASANWATIGGGVGGSTAIDLINNETLSYIDGGAQVRAQNNVGVIAWSDDLITNVAGGFAGAGLGAGVGASNTVSEMGGRTAAYIEGETTSVTALAKDASRTLEVAEGGLTKPLNLENGLTPEPADFNPFLNLAEHRKTEQVRGVAVNASATHHIQNFVANAAGGAFAGVNGINNVSVIAGTTEAYVDQAKINAASDGAGSAGQSLHVSASDHSLASGFMARASLGAGGVGAGVNTNVFARETRAYVANSSEIRAVDRITVRAASTQSATSMVVGASGGIVGVAGTVNVGVFAGTTESYVQDSTVHTGALDVDARHTSRIFASGGTAAAGGGAVGATFVVSVSQSTARAYVDKSTVTASGAISVNALTDAEVQAWGASAGIGGIGVAGVGIVSVVNNQTESYVRQSDLGSRDARAGSLSVTALDRVTAKNHAGTFGAGGGSFGAAIAITYVGNVTSASFDQSKAYTSGGAAVDAQSERYLNTVGASIGAGMTSFNGVAAVTLVGSLLSGDVLSQVDDGGPLSLSQVNRLIEQDRIVADGEEQNIQLALDGDYSFDVDNGDGSARTVERESPIGQGDLAAANSSGRVDVKGVVTQGAPGSTSARVTGGSVIEAGGDIRVESDVRDLASISVGAAGGGASAVGAGIGVLHVANRVEAELLGGSTLSTSGGSIRIQAVAGRLTRDTDIDLLCDRNSAASVCAFQGSLGLGGSMGAAVAINTVANTVTAMADRGTSLGVTAGAGSIEVIARDLAEAYASASGFRAALNAAAGAVLATASKLGSGLALIGDGEASGASTSVNLAAGRLAIESGRSGRVKAYTLAGAGGVGSALTGSGATASDDGSSRAKLGNQVIVNGANADVSLLAEATPQADAEARGYSGSVFGGVGASLASATAKPVVEASIGYGGIITARSLSVEGVVSRAGDAMSARSFAEAAGLGVLGVGVTANSSEATSQVTVTSAIGSTLAISGNVNVEARNASMQFASVSGLAGGASAAFGANVAYANASSSTMATVHHSVTGTVGGALSVDASGNDGTYAEALAGTGGVIAGEASRADTSNSSTTVATLGASNLTAGSVDVNAVHTAAFNSKVDSLRASVLGASGAGIHHHVQSTVAAHIGNSSKITTGDLNVVARNVSRKAELGSEGLAWKIAGGYHANAGSGGLAGGAAVSSSSAITHTTRVRIGNDAAITVREGSEGRTNFSAVNDLLVRDKTRLDSGDVISAALARSTATVTANSLVEMGAGASIDSVGDINMGSLTIADVSTSAYAKTEGLSSAAMGQSLSSITANESVTVGTGSSLRSDGDISFLAGRDAAGTVNRIKANAVTELYNKTAFPIVNDPEADARVTRHARIDIGSGASVRSVGDVNLLTNHGSVHASGTGKGTDLYRELAEDVGNAFAEAVGAGEVSLEIKGGSQSVNVSTGVTVNGVLEAGIYSRQVLRIDKDGHITEQSEGIDVEVSVENLLVNLNDRLQQLYTLRRAYAVHSEAAAAFDAEINFIKQEMRRMGYTPENIPEGYVPNEYNAEFITVSDVLSRGGNINVTGDYLAGSGHLNASSEVEITIINESPRFLRLNGLTIDPHGGHVNFNEVSVSGSADINSRNLPGSPEARFQVDAAGSIDYDPQITVSNTFNPSSHGSNRPAPDIELTGDVTNMRGTVTVHNARGGIKLQGADGKAAPHILANTVSLQAAHGSIMQSYVDGFVHVGGDPRSIWSDFEYHHENHWFSTPRNEYQYAHERVEYWENCQPMPFTNCTPENKARELAYWRERIEVLEEMFAGPRLGSGSWIAGNNVLISARYLNINGTVQSGIADWDVTLGWDLIDKITDFKQRWREGKLSAGARLQLTGFENDPVGTIAAFYDPETDQIMIEDVKVQGGYAELYGEIMNTGGGHIKVMDGYGRINIQSDLPYDIVINALDTGDDIKGIVRITDTAKRYNGRPITYEYQRDRDQVRISQWAGDQYIGGNVVDGPTATFTPEGNLRYVWLRGQDESEEYKGVARSEKIIGLIEWDSEEYETWTRTKSGITNLPDGIYVDRAGQQDPYDYWREYFRVEKKRSSRKEEWECKEWIIFFCGLWEHVVTDWWVDGAKEVFIHSARADYPIDVSFIGYTAADGGISVSGAKNVIIAGPVSHTGGEVSIKTGFGQITQSSKDSRIVARDINLTAGRGIGRETEALSIRLVGESGSLSASSLGDIHLNGLLGDVRLGSVSSAEGSVVISADRNIVQVGGGSDPAITGNRIDLTSRAGGIGADGQPLNIQAGTTLVSGLNATAPGDIFIRQTDGDFRLIEIRSIGGDVWLEAAKGSFVDANTSERRDQRKEDELLQLWDELMLIGDKAEESAQMTVDAYVLARERDYHLYWGLRGVRPVVDEHGEFVGYTADDFDLSQIEGMELIDEAKYLELDAAYGSASYDPDFSYQISEAERAALTEGSSWTKEQLQYSLSRGILFKQTTSTETRIEDPNVIGRNVTLIATQGSVGTDNGEIVVDGNDPEEFKREEVRLALAAAEADDVAVDNETNRITILLRDSIDVAATGEIVVEGRDHVYLGSRQSIYVNTIQSGDSIRIKGTDGLYSVSTSGAAKIQGNHVILEGGAGGIGTADNPITLDLADGATLTARAAQDIHIQNLLGNLHVAQIYGESGVHLTARGSILHSGLSPVTIQGGDVNLVSQEGSIGTADTPLVLLLSPSGILTATSAGGSIYANAHGNILNVGDLTSSERIELGSLGNVHLHGSISAPGIFALTAAGSATQEDESVIDTERLSIVAGQGIDLGGENQVARFSATNLGSGDIAFTNVGGDLTLEGISQTTGGVSISNSGGRLVIAQAMTLGSGAEEGGDVRLAAGGEISQSLGAVIVGASLLSTTSSGAQTLDQDNRVRRFEAINESDGNISFFNSDAALEIVGISQAQSGTVNVDQEGSLQITGVVATGGTVILSAIGSIGQTGGTGAVHVGYLDVSSGGEISLVGANAVRSLRAVNTGSGHIAFVNTAESLELLEIVQADRGDVSVDHTGRLVVGTIRAREDVVTLSATSTIAQRDEGSAIDAGTLRTVSVGGVTLDQNVSARRFEAANQGGDIVLVSTVGSLELGDVTQSDGDVDITNDGNVEIVGRISATGETDGVRITAIGTIEQDAAQGAVEAARLVTSSDGSQLLVGANEVGLFEAINEGTGEIVLVNGSGALAIAGITQVEGGHITVHAGGDVDIDGVIATIGNVALTASGRITQEEEHGAIDAAFLTVASHGGQSLGGVNTVASFETSNTGEGEIVFANVSDILEIIAARQADGGDVEIGQIGSILLSGVLQTQDSVYLTASEAIVQDESAGAIDAVRLVTSSDGGQTLTGANTVTFFEATNTGAGEITFVNVSDILEIVAARQGDGGDISVSNGGRLVIGTMETADAVSLSATGSIAQSGATSAIDAALLRIASVGGVTLDQNIAVHRLEARNTGGDITLATNVDSLEIGHIEQADGGDIVVASGGGAEITGVLATSGQVRIDAAGRIEQHAASGRVDASNLWISSLGGMSLGGANTVDRFKAINTGGGEVELRNVSDSLTIAGINQGHGGDIDVHQTGRLQLSGLVRTDGGVRLVASEGIEQDVEDGVVEASDLVVVSHGGQFLGGVNSVARLEATNTGGGTVMFTNSSDSLEVVGINQVDGGNIDINQMGRLRLSGLIRTADSVRLSATGAIDQAEVGGGVEAAHLVTSSRGGQSLLGANTVWRFEATNAGDGSIRLVNTSETLEIAALSQIDGGEIVVDQTGRVDISGSVQTSGTVQLTATSTITQSDEGQIEGVATLITSSRGGQLLTGANVIDSIRATNIDGGDIRLNNASDRLDIVNIDQAGGDVIAYQLGDLAIVGSVRTDLDLVLSASGSIENHNVDDAIILTGRNIELASENGDIGEDARRIVISAAEHVNATAAGDIYLEVRGGVLLSDWLHSQSGSVDLLASDGISVGQMRLGRGARLRADNIHVDEMIHGGEAPLRLVVHGVSGLVDSAVIHASSDVGILFDRLEADYARVDADTEMLHFLNTRIKSVGEFNNRYYSARVDNVNRALFEVDLQLYAPDRAFYLLMGTDKRMETDAFIFNFNPELDLGASGNQVSVIRLVSILPYIVGKGTAGSEDDSAGSILDWNGFAFNGSNGVNGNGFDDEIDAPESLADDEEDEEPSDSDEQSKEDDQ